MDTEIVDAAGNVLPQLSHAVIGCAMRVHSAFGPGLLESVYEECPARELEAEGMAFRRQMPIPLRYRDATLDCAFRLDLLVEGRVVVEIKAVDQILPIHESQLLTYLRLTQKPLGLLINFNVRHLRDGIRRRVNTVRP